MQRVQHMGLPNATYDLIGNYRKVPLDINHWTGQPSFVQCPFTIHVGTHKLISAKKSSLSLHRTSVLDFPKLQVGECKKLCQCQRI